MNPSLETATPRTDALLAKLGVSDARVGDAGVLRDFARQLERAIAEHNEGCDVACEAQRPNERQSGGCGYQKHDGSYIYRRNCPNCPKDWKIELPTGAHQERAD